MVGHVEDLDLRFGLGVDEPVCIDSVEALLRLGPLLALFILCLTSVSVKLELDILHDGEIELQDQRPQYLISHHNLMQFPLQ